MQRDLVHSPYVSFRSDNNWIPIQLRPLFSQEDNLFQYNLPTKRKNNPSTANQHKKWMVFQCRLPHNHLNHKGLKEDQIRKTAVTKSRTQEQAATKKNSIREGQITVSIHHKTIKNWTTSERRSKWAYRHPRLQNEPWTDWGSSL